MNRRKEVEAHFRPNEYECNNFQQTQAYTANNILIKLSTNFIIEAFSPPPPVAVLGFSQRLKLAPPPPIAPSKDEDASYKQRLNYS